MGDKWEYKIVKFEMPSDWPMGKLLYDDLKVKHADCMNELGQEKIDIISWSDVPEKFVMNSLSPAKVTRVEILPRHEARALLPEDQLSLAIGKGGQNVRLAHRLTGWKIDVRSEVNPNIVQEGGVSSREEGGDAASESEEGVGSQE